MYHMSNAPETLHESDGQEPDRAPRVDRWFPEGVITSLVAVAYIVCSTAIVQFSDWYDYALPLILIGALAVSLGVLVGKSRAFDVIAHSTGTISGALIVIGMTLLIHDEVGSGWHGRVSGLWSVVHDWYSGQPGGQDGERIVLGLLLGMAVWYLCYLASWTFFRRRWLGILLLLPGLLAVTSVALSKSSPAWMLIPMAALGIYLIVAVHFLDLRHRWFSGRMSTPTRLPSKIISIGFVSALIIGTVAAAAPETIDQRSLQPTFDRLNAFYNRRVDNAQDLMNGNAPDSNASLSDAGSYTAFDNAFSVGGPLELSNTPEVLVQTSGGAAPYLTAHTYDLYTGRGWVSSSDDGSDPEQAMSSRSPGLLYGPEQAVVLSSTMVDHRDPVSISVRPLAANNGVVFSVQTFQSASIDVVVRMSWRIENHRPFAISGPDIPTLPPDIQRLASLLVQSSLTGASTSVGPEAADTADQEQIDLEVASLSRRNISVSWQADDNGSVTTVYVTGPLPVYDDVEGVSRSGTSASGSYQVQNLVSTASPEQLMAASTEYPAYIQSRYLSIGTTITPRTVDLARQLGATGDNPYDKAIAIQDYLRQTIAYNENVPEPPDGADVVDYVLFENQQGYCEYYASAMTVLLRLNGIPARTVAGYYPGQLDENRGGYVYLQSNAHAWTEAYFPGYGWIPFEPTANRPLSNVDDDQQATPEVSMENQTPPSGTVPAVEDAGGTPAVGVGAGTPAANLPPIIRGDSDSGRPGWLIPFGIVAALGAAGYGLLWFIWQRDLRGLSPSASLYGRVRKLSRLAGLHITPTTTPREHARKLDREWPAVGRHAREIIQVYELDAFGPARADGSAIDRARDAWHRIRRSSPRIALRLLRPGRGGR